MRRGGRDVVVTWSLCRDITVLGNPSVVLQRWGGRTLLGLLGWLLGLLGWLLVGLLWAYWLASWASLGLLGLIMASFGILGFLTVDG